MQVGDQNIAIPKLKFQRRGREPSSTLGILQWPNDRGSPARASLKTDRPSPTAPAAFGPVQPHFKRGDAADAAWPMSNDS